MADLLTLAEILERVQSRTQSGATNYGQWPPARKIQLINESQLAVYEEIIESFEEMFFCEVSANLTPVSNEINLAALPKPYHRRLAFQKLVGPRWMFVRSLTIGDASVSDYCEEEWYQVGLLLRTDSPIAQTGTYRVIYNYRIPDLVNNGDVCQIPREYSEMVPLYAAMQAFLDAKKNDDYATNLVEWNRRVDKMKTTAANRAADRTRRIKDTLGLRRKRYFLYGNQINY